MTMTFPFRSSLRALPLALALPAALLAQSAGAPATPVDDKTVVLDPFVVNALTEERDRSTEAKRNADSIGEYLSTDRLGLFVDNDIGSVIERLPGLYNSGAGQSGGDAISIRGLGGGFNSLQVDGDRIPSNQGGTRGVSIDNIPAELIGAIEVFKAPTPAKEADSIGGIVNVETKSGLDLKRRLIATRFQYGVDDYRSGDQWGGSLSYSDRVGQNLGVFFSLSHRDSTRVRDEIVSDPGDYFFDQIVTTNSALPQLTAANTSKVFLPSRTDYRRTWQQQQRTGANLNFDWQVSETWRLSLRTFFDHFEEQRPQLRNLWRYDRSTGTDPVNRNYPHAEYVYLDEAAGTFYFGNEQRIARRIADQAETEDIARVQVEGVHRWKDSRLDYSASFGRSRRELANDTYIFTADNIQLRAGVRDSLNPSFDVIRPGDFFYNSTAKPRVPDFDDGTYYGPADSGYFNITERRAEVIDAKDQIQTYAANYRRTLANGFKIQAGARFRSQRKDNQRDFVINPGFTFAAANSQFSSFNGFFDGRQDLGLFPTYATLAAQNQGSPRQFVASVLGGTPSADNRRDSTIQDIGATEDVTGLYAQASRDFGPLTLLGGVRWEDTSATYRGFTADVTGNPAIDTPRAVSGRRGYDGFYPSLHANLKIRENLYLRLSVGRTLARPEFADLTPSSYSTLSVDSDSGAATVNVQRGNARLNPTQSVNYDASLEYYFAKGGLLSLAVFRKDMSNWIYRSDVIAPPSQFPEYAAIPNLTTVRVSSALNGDEAKVSGVEFNVEHNLFWGFSAGFNATFLTFDVNREQTGLDRVPGQSDRLLRASLSYEWRRFLARISLRDSGEILDSQVAFTAPAAIAYFQGLGLGQITTPGLAGQTINLGLYEKSPRALDLYAEYALTKRIRVFTQFNNLLREASQTFLENDSRFATENEYRSWNAVLGVKMNF